MTTDTRRTALIIVADIVALFLFAAIGRQTHSETNQLIAVLSTGMPFVVAWLAVSGLSGLHRPQPFKRWIVTTLGWAPIATLVALALRSMLLGKPILVTFAIVSVAVTTLFLVLVRVLFSLRRGTR
ncbi:MAG: hypothetical protein RLZZ297_1895 [Chloroflexota bacterium]